MSEMNKTISAVEEAMREAREAEECGIIGALCAVPRTLERSEHVMTYRLTEPVVYTDRGTRYVTRLIRVTTTVEDNETFTQVEAHAVMANANGEPNKRAHGFWCSVPDVLVDRFPASSTSTSAAPRRHRDEVQSILDALDAADDGGMDLSGIAHVRTMLTKLRDEPVQGV